MEIKQKVSTQLFSGFIWILAADKKQLKESF
jgi:hypothetical protein